MMYDAEFRRCLLQADLPGIMAVWKHVAPHLAAASPSEALCALHMARVGARRIPDKLKDWSRAWLAEQGYHLVDGKWIHTDLPVKVKSYAVGIASGNAAGVVLPFNRKIVRHMENALLDGLAKGITEPPMQREVMLKARAKVRFKARMD